MKKKRILATHVELSFPMVLMFIHKPNNWSIDNKVVELLQEVIFHHVINTREKLKLPSQQK